MRPAVVAAALVLAPSGVSCQTILAAGASFPDRLYQDAIFAYSFVEPDVKMTYVPVGSGSGNCRIMDHSTKCKSTDTIEPTVISWAGSDSLLKDSDYAQFPDLQMYPTVAGAMTPIYNLPTDTAGYSSLKLTKSVLAAIFRGAITTWGHASLVSLNPWLANMPSPNATIEVVVRSDSSGSTEVFKKALAAFDPVFKSQVGTSSSSSWSGVTVTKQDTNYGVTAYVKAKTYALGYSVLAEAATLNVAQAVIEKTAGVYVEASAVSVELALAELGLNFGNNGDPASRLTADVHNAQGPLAWPIAGYTYLVMRKETTHTDAGQDCSSRRATVNYWDWFYTSTAVQDMARANGFAPLPDAVAKVVLAQLRANILCEGSVVYEPPISLTVEVLGSEAMSSIAYYISIAYKQVDSSILIRYSSTLSNSTVNTQLLSSTLTYAANAVGKQGPALSMVWEAVELDSELVRIPIAGIAISFVYTLCDSLAASCFASGKELVLDLPTIAALVDGEISTWGDSRLSALNPWMQESAAATVLAAAPMVLHGESISSDTMQMLKLMLATVKPSVAMSAFETGSSIGTVWPSATAVMSATAVQPLSIGVTPLLGAMPTLLQIASVSRTDAPSTYLEPTSGSVLSCGGDASIQLHQSTDPSCYPLSARVVMLVRRDFRTDECAGEFGTPLPLATARLLEWILTGNSSAPLVAPLQANNLAPLFVTLPESHVSDSLLSITCNGTSMLRIVHNENFLPDGLRICGLGTAYLAMASGFILGVWVLIKRKHKVVKAAQPAFLLVTIAGTWMSLATIIPASDDHSRHSPELGSTPNTEGVYPALDFGCNMQVVCYSIGFATTFGALFAKLQRVVKLVVNPGNKRVKVTAASMMTRVLACVIVEAVILVLMLTNDDSRFYYGIVIVGRDSQGNVVESYGECTATDPWAYILTIAALHCSALLYGNYLCYKSRKVQSEYNEGKYLTFALVNTLQTHLFAIMLAVFVSDKVIPFYLIKWLAIMVSAAGTLALMLVPKLISVYMPNMDKTATGMWIFVRKASTTAMVSPEKTCGNSSTTGDDRNSDNSH